MGILNTQISNNSDSVNRNFTIHPSNIQIISRGTVIGMVQSINPSESVNVTKVQALGVEGVVTSAKSNYTGGTFSTPLIVIYDSSPFESFGVEDEGGGVGGLRQLTRVKGLYQQRIPLDIRQVIYTPSLGSEDITTYVNCWITSFGTTVNISSAVVNANVSWTYEKVV